ncbi:MAG: epoxyqueuosine reductase QueH [Clostridia bacterium]|nr:epoxyqueuosine reductase QueH [Clostridia bacterium]
MDNKRNYQKELDNIIASLDGKKPRLLLHACCAPCSSYCLEYLKDYFDITLFFYNPNITDKEEFDKRYAELKRLVREMDLDINIVCPTYCKEEFSEKVKGYENCLEGGDRCWICYALRLDKACRYAEDNDYDYYCSTLSISPYKNSDKLNEIGESLAKGKKVKHLPNDFKKKGGYARSIQLSKDYSLYRQNYCGCEYSKLQRENSL